MKDKNVAGILALFFGWIGVHRFYLGQVGLGLLYLFLFFFFGLSVLLGLIDAIAFFSMDQESFNVKYNRNKDDWRERPEFERNRDVRYRERVERREERREERRDRRAPERPRAQAPARPSNEALKNSGIQKYKDYDYEGAIADFEKALEINPNDVAVHFNLACALSLTEEADEAFLHLDRAVALGFNDFARIKTHDALAYLRIQDKFDAFEANGFRLEPGAAPSGDAPKAIEATPLEPLGAPPSADLLEQLKRLGELRERGLLTEDEFASQKRKLLG